MKNTLYTLGLYVFALLITSCGANLSQADEEQGTENLVDARIFVSKAQFEKGKMMLGSIEEKIFSSTVKCTGIIDVPPENKAIVNATMGGYIKKSPLLIGDVVRKGQELITLENAEFVTLQQNCLEITEQLTYLKSEFERQQTMWKEKISSQKKYLQAESTYKSAVATQKSLEKKLAMLNISLIDVKAGRFTSLVTLYSPISGSVTKVNVNRGSYVSPATAILEIVDNNHIHLELSVFEKDVLQVKRGQSIRFRIPESSKKNYKAEVHLMGTAIEENRTIQVHGHINDESEENFLTGMFVDADIITASTSAKAVPQTAIVEREGKKMIVLMDEKTETGYYFKPVEIEIGASYNGNVALKTINVEMDSKPILLKGVFSVIAD